MTRQIRHPAPFSSLAPLSRPGFRAAALALLAPAAMALLGGCGGNVAVNAVPAASENAVTVGTQPNSLPPAPAQSTSNRYAGVDTTENGINWNWTVSQPEATYNYEQQEGPNASANGNSFGIFSNVGDFEFFSDTFYLPFQFFGLNAEIASGVSLFQPAFSGFPTGGLVIGVPSQPSSCLAPDGQVAVNYVAVPPQAGSATAATDTLYGQTSLAYKNDQFTYAATTQLAPGALPATTTLFPFVASYCIQAGAGYGMQSTMVFTGDAPTTVTGSTSTNSITYTGATGMLVGVTTAINSGTDTNGNPTTSTAHGGFVGAVQPTSPIDLSKVIAGTYKGFNASTSVPQADPAYFGQSSPFVTAPVLTQTATSLVGGSEDFIGSFTFSPTPQPVPGIVLVDFGVQDTKQNGLFPSAMFTEQDPMSVCPAAQQTTGSDGMTYCTFPVVALVAESYGKFSIFIVGPELPAGKQLFYALVQD